MEIKINIEKKYVWVLPIALVAVGFVVAYGTNEPQKMGHTVNEIEGLQQKLDELTSKIGTSGGGSPTSSQVCTGGTCLKVYDFNIGALPRSSDTCWLDSGNIGSKQCGDARLSVSRGDNCNVFIPGGLLLCFARSCTQKYLTTHNPFGDKISNILWDQITNTGQKSSCYDQSATKFRIQALVVTTQ